MTGPGTPPHDPGARLEEILREQGFAPEPTHQEANAADTPPHAEPREGAEPGDTEPGDTLPDVPLFALLRVVERDIAVQAIDRIWIFPPRRHETGETAVVVVAAYHDTDHQRRTVFAAHYIAQSEPAGTRLTLQEYGSAPADRVGRVVEEVVERLKEEPAVAPHAARIEGNAPRWHELLHLLAEQEVDAASSSARARRGG